MCEIFLSLQIPTMNSMEVGEQVKLAMCPPRAFATPSFTHLLTTWQAKLKRLQVEIHPVLPRTSHNLGI